MPDSALFEKLFFQLSRPCFDRKAKRDGSALDESDLYAFSALACRNGVTGFIYRNTKEPGVFPEEFQGVLRDAYQRTTFHNLDQLAETLKILKLLSAHKIQVILLKGVVASELLFHDLGVYPSSDIDILVHPDDLTAVKQVLQTHAGYSTVQERGEEELLSGHYHYMLHKKQYLVEVHWNLTKRYFEVPPEFWWQGSQTVSWRGINILELSPEKYLMYAVFRLFDHCFFPLRFMVLIAGILDRYTSEICWHTLMEDCRQFKMKRLMIFTLQLTHELLAAKVPAVLLEKEIFGYSALKKLCLSGMLKGIERKHLRMMCYTALLDSPADVARALIGRLIPSRAELCLRYNLPPDSFKIFLYYIMNPVLLLLKSSEKGQRRKS